MSENTKTHKVEKESELTNAPKSQDHTKANKKTVFTYDRTLWTFTIIFGYFGIIYLGHSYIAIFMTFLNIMAFREFYTLKFNAHQDIEKIGLRKYIYIYFFVIALVHLTASAIKQPLNNSTTSIPDSSIIKHFVLYQGNFSFYAFWMVGFLVFVITLKQGFYKFQFSLFAWAHIFIFIYTAQKTTTISNVYNGLIWFLLPSTLVGLNDMNAYVFGKLFGRTKLIALSPNKTLEGFIGGAFVTVLGALLIGYLFAIFSYHPFIQHLICPMETLTMEIKPVLYCEPGILFERRLMTMPLYSSTFGKVVISEFEIHCLVLSLFTSLISPFGGFFASGLKRAMKIKDFSSLIPGHGGIIDRCDCQVIAASFTFLYLREIIRGGYSSIGSVQYYLMGLNLKDQLKLYEILGENLKKNNMLDYQLIILNFVQF